MVEAFSLLAVGTSLIGTLLGFSEFFKEQLNSLSWHSPSIQVVFLPPFDSKLIASLKSSLVVTFLVLVIIF